LDKVIDGPSVIFAVYEPLPDHPTAAPNSWDAGSDAATTIWTATNPTTGALLDWSLRSDASWLKAEFAASSDDPNGTGVLSPDESLSIPLLVNRDDLRSGAYSGSVFFDYSENTGISGSLEINEEMSAFNMLCFSDLNDNGQIDFSEAVKLAIQYLLVKPIPALGRVPSLTETLKIVMAH
jgi:hypothetical protein